MKIFKVNKSPRVPVNFIIVVKWYTIWWIQWNLYKTISNPIYPRIFQTYLFLRRIMAIPIYSKESFTLKILIWSRFQSKCQSAFKNVFFLTIFTILPLQEISRYFSLTNWWWRGDPKLIHVNRILSTWKLPELQITNVHVSFIPLHLFWYQMRIFIKECLQIITL